AGMRESINYPLGLVVDPLSGLRMRLTYRPDLFDERAARALLDRLLRVLKQMAADPRPPVGRIEPADDAQRSRGSEGWNHEAGGALVPLDPEYPADRLGYMIGDSGAQIVLGAGETLAEVPVGMARAVLLDEPGIGEAIAAQPVEPPGVAVAADQLAYVIYTS